MSRCRPAICSLPRYHAGVRLPPSINLDRKGLAELCRRHGIQKLALFGSALRADFRAESDVDVLAEFMPGHTPGLSFFVIADELSALLGRHVDLHTRGSLSPYFRDLVLAEAEPLYVQT